MNFWVVMINFIRELFKLIHARSGRNRMKFQGKTPFY